MVQAVYDTIELKEILQSQRERLAEMRVYL